MFVNNINPDLINIGPLSIRFYGIVYALGFLLVTYLISKKAEKKKIKHLTKDRAVDLVTYTMIFGLFGARLFHVLDNIGFYWSNPLNMFAIWNGGLVFQGGALIGALFAYFYCKKHKIKLWQVFDAIVVPLPLIIGFGRIANFMNSEIIGPVTNLPWCVVFQKIDDFCRHPTQLYLGLAQFTFFFILFFLSKKKLKKGVLTGVFLIGYGLIRLIFDFLRDDFNIKFLSLSLTQIFGIFMIIYGVYLIKKKYAE